MATKPRIVCPPELLDLPGLKIWELVLAYSEGEYPEPNLLKKIPKNVTSVWLRLPQSMSELLHKGILDSVHDTKTLLDIHCAGTGDLMDILLNPHKFSSGGKIQFTLPLNKENIKAVRILSSLGITTNLRLVPETIKTLDWDEFLDLADWYHYSKNPHARIALLDKQEPAAQGQIFGSMSAAWYDAASSYVFIDKEQQVYISQEAMKAGRAILGGLDALDGFNRMAEYQDYVLNLRKPLLTTSVCGSCEGYLTCHGSWWELCRGARSAKEFFSELHDIHEEKAENHKNQQGIQGEQPGGSTLSSRAPINPKAAG